MDIIWQFEIGITLFFQALGRWLTLPMQGISFLGQEEFFLVVMPAIYWCIDAGLGLRLGVMLISTSSLSGWLKMAIGHPRPYWFDRRVAALASEPSFGMPSSHAQNAMAMWGLMARLRGGRGWWALAILVVALTGISRIYLGVHFADQVVVGWLIGAMLIWVYMRLEKRTLSWIRRMSLASLLLWVAGVSLCMLVLTFGLNLGARSVPSEWIANAQAAAPQTPIAPYDPSGLVSHAGVWLGLAGGAAWDWRRHGKPVTCRNPMNLLLRYVLGGVGLAVLYLGLKMVFPATSDLVGMTLRYVRYALVGLWVTAAAPAVFRKARLV
jgi:membrane-associated phospholipid phosphatase